MRGPPFFIYANVTFKNENNTRLITVLREKIGAESI